MRAPENRQSLALGLIGLALLAQVALRPTTEARGYVLAAIAWLALASTLWLTANRRLRRGLYLFLICVGAASALYGLVQAIGGIDAIGTYQRGLGRIATGTHIHRNHFAGLLNMTMALALGALYAGYAERFSRGLRKSETFAWTWLVILSCAVIGLAVFLSLSRAGSLILLATLFFVFVLLQLRRGRDRHTLPARITAILLVATLGLSLAYGMDGLMERFDSLEESNRPLVYRDTLRLIADHPIRGVGPGLYRWRFRPYQTLETTAQFTHTHNDYLQVAAEWGIPLALLFWGFVGWRFVRALRLFFSHRSPATRGMALGCAAAIFAILIHSMVDFNLQIPANLAYFAVVLGLGWNARTAPGQELGMTARLLRLLLAAAMLLAAWQVGRRYMALRIALATPAAAGFERALDWDPANPDLHFMLAGLYRDVPALRDADAAREHGERAAELSPHSWRAQSQLAQLYEVAGLDEEAERAYLRTIELNPLEAADQWRLANFYLRSGELDRAYPPLEVALAADRSLWEPGWTLLSKLGASLTQIDLVWPESRSARLLLLESLVRDRQTVRDPALSTFLSSSWDRLLATGKAPTPQESAFFLDYLLETDRADEARRRWVEIATANGIRDEAFESRQNLIWNGRFEIPLTQIAFDWRIVRSEAFTVRTAAGEGHLGSTALRIDFRGVENREFAGVRQRVSVRPGIGYELFYQARSLGLTTDEGVFLEIWAPDQQRRLMASEKTVGTSPWSPALLTLRDPTRNRVDRGPGAPEQEPADRQPPRRHLLARWRATEPARAMIAPEPHRRRFLATRRHRCASAT